MRPIAAIVESAIDIRQIERAVHAAHIALRDAESSAERDRARAESSEETAKMRRIDLGRELHSAKSKWSRSGSFAETWKSFLARMGISETSSRRYISEYEETKTTQTVDSTAQSFATSVQVAGDSAVNSNTSANTSATNTPASDEFHILIESGRLRGSVIKIARQWPDSARQSIPGLLRDLADEIEAGL